MVSALGGLMSCVVSGSSQDEAPSEAASIHRISTRVAVPCLGFAVSQAWSSIDCVFSVGVVI